MKPLPTDLEILNAIYERYYNEFAHQAGNRDSKAVVPIDCEEIARDLGVDVDIVFGRLHYHLEPKYRRLVDARQIRGEEVTVFLGRSKFGFDAVHFPYLASVLAELRAEERKQKTQTNIAWFSLAVSGAAVLVSLLVALFGK